MADNVAVTEGSGKTIATDDVGGVQHQLVKMEFGVDGAATMVSAGDPLPVYFPTAQAVTVSGVATSAKQDTAQTSFDAIKTALEIMDDWDETNRAAVNPIASQIGVQGGSGVVSANTQRMVLATDVGLPAGTNNIGDVDIASIAAGDNNIGNVDLASSIPAGTNNIGDVDVLTVPTDPFGANADASSATGSISAKLRYIATNMALESAGNLAAIAASLSVLDDWDETNRAAVNLISGQVGVQGGSGAISASTQRVTISTDDTVATDLTAIRTALQLIDDPVFADDAAYTLSTSKGNVAAGVAVQTDGTDPTAVSAEGDAAALRTDMNRILLVNTTPPRLTSASENNATAQTNNPILSAPGAGLSLYITDIVVSNGATAGSIRFVEDTAGTPVIRVQETYMAINGGAVIPLNTPIRITANKDFGYTSTTVTTHSITVSGYIAP